jgi:hypothetical protein
MQAMPPTVLSTKVQAAIDSYHPYPIGPTLADHVGLVLTNWLSSSPSCRGGGGSGGPTPLISGGDGGTPFNHGGDGPNPLCPMGGDGPHPLYSAKELAAGVATPKLIGWGGGGYSIVVTSPAGFSASTNPETTGFMHAWCE